MLGRHVLPTINNCFVIAVEVDPFLVPVVTPCERCREDGEELLPLNGCGGGQLLVGLPRVVKPLTAIVGTTPMCA